MKKLKSVLSPLLIGIMMTTLFCPAMNANAAAASAIIANHEHATLADLLAIPMEWIDKARADLHIYYNHTSHGSQITSGMTGLADFKGKAYAWNTSGKNGALHLDDVYSTDLGDSNWHKITRSYLKDHPEINVVMWSWCGQVSSASETYINNYLSNMSKLEQDYPNVRFVYMTGHTDGTGVTGDLHLRNEQIRQYCRANNKILFDFADIESYDPDGRYYLNKAVNDECNYDSDGNGSRESNWATAWQNSHTQNVDWYSCGSAHSEPLNANMKAYAAWYLWARLAGWDGNTTASLITDSYPEMASNLELLFESAGIHVDSLNATYGIMMRQKAVINLTTDKQDKLRELAKSAFQDIKGDEWYAFHIPMAVYSKLIKGFPDKTFKGNNLVTRAEVLTMLARLDSSEEMIRQKAEKDAGSLNRFTELIGNDWYTNYVIAAKECLLHADDCTRDTILKPMTRGEVFYALASFLWRDEIQGDGKYYNMAVINDKPAFGDTFKTIQLSGPDDDQKDYNWYMQLEYASEHPEMGVPMDFYPAVLCLKDKGILQGNKGESKWQDPITRAEVLALLERLAMVWGSESK